MAERSCAFNASTILSTSGCLLFSSGIRSSPAYTSLVETFTAGFATRRTASGGAQRGVSTSPIPSDSMVPPSIQKGMSAPSGSAILHSSSMDRRRSNISFIARKVAAASALPPAIPAAIGIFLSSLISNPCLMEKSSRIRSHAFQIRFVLSPARDAFPVCRRISPVSFEQNSSLS